MFEKLYNRPTIKGSGMQKIDMVLGFQSATLSLTNRYVNFLEFCHVMVHFYELKMVGQNGYIGSFSTFIDSLLLY